MLKPLPLITVAPLVRPALLRIHLLGTLRIEYDDAPIHLPRRKVESLLAYLLLNPEQQGRDRLATLFWGDSSDEQARHSLRTALATLRQAIDPDLLLSDREHVRLNPDFPVWVDLHELLALETKLDSVHAEQLLTKLRLWQGDLLAGHYDDWIGLEREYYRTQVITLFSNSIQSLRARSEYQAAIEVGQRLLTLDPANERTHQHLMFCYMAAGNRSAALRQYELCEHTLQTELDAPPMSATVALYHWLKENNSDEGAPAKITNLPIPLTSFVGRTQQVAEVKQMLNPQEPISRLLTLIGAGGSGKTRLAIQVATDLIDSFANGVWWVELATLNESEQVVRAVAKALGVSEVKHELTLERITTFVGDRRLLLVIDNCEHLVASVAQLVANLLRRCPDLQLLTTSREALNVSGEILWQVPPLSLPNPHQSSPSDLFLQYECIRLFVERAVAVQQDFRLTLENAPTVVEICTRLDGIPLAIELAAARVKVLPVEQIAARLTSAIGARFALLTQGSRTALPRQQTLRAAIDWSYKLLDADERQLFQQVAIFRGGFTLEAVERVVEYDGGQQVDGQLNYGRMDSGTIDSGTIEHHLPSTVDHLLSTITLPNTSQLATRNSLDLLTQLVDKSLVVVEQQSGQNRYRLLETLREYALEQVPTEAQRKRFQHRHATYFLDTAEQARRQLNGPQLQLWVNRAEIEHPNLRAALDYLIANNEGEMALRLAVAIYHFWDIRGYHNEGRKWLQLALAKRGTATVITQAKALNAAGRLAYGQSDLNQARPFYKESLSLFETIGDDVGVAMALQNLALIEMEQGEYVEAEQRLERSLHLCRTLHYEYGIARGLRYLGALAYDQDRIIDACDYYRESLRIHQAHGDRVSIAHGFLKVGDTERRLGNLGAAHTNYETCLKIGRNLDHSWLIGTALNGLALVALVQVDYAQARKHGEEALHLFRKLGDKSLIGFALSTLGDVARAVGEHNKALMCYCENLQIVHEVGYKWPIFEAFENLAHLLTEIGQHLDLATRFLGAAKALRQRAGLPIAAHRHLEHEHTTHSLRQHLGNDWFNQQWQEGQNARLEALVAEATRIAIG